MNINKWLAPKKNESLYLKTNRSLKSKTSNYLEPETIKKFDWYSDNVKKSQKSSKVFSNDEFTNYLNQSSKNEFYNNFYDYAKNLNKLKKYGLDPDLEITERLERIFALYLDTNDIDKTKIAKIRVETQTEGSTSLRIYILMNSEAYKVFLIDPLHLVIPSKRQIREQTYLRNKGNGLCISREINRAIEY